MRFRIPAHHGKPMQWSKFRKYPTATKAQAKRRAEEYRQELEEQINDYALIEGITFGEYARRWHEDRGELEIVKKSTWLRDELEIKQIEQSKIANIPIDEIDADDIDEFKKENKRAGFSNDKQDKLLKKVKQILKFAARRRTIRHDPSPAVENIKRKIEKPRKALSRKDQKRLLSALEEGDINGLTTVVRIALSTGYRRGEVLGLQWGDVDFRNKIIRLERQLTARREYDTPKHDSTGTIPMDGDLCAWLKEWKRITSREHYKGGKVPDNSPVCRNLTNGKQLQAAWTNKWFRGWCVKHGFGTYEEETAEWDSLGIKRYHKRGYKGLTLHELRHTMATEAVAAADLKTAQTILRHTNISTTAGYIHEIDENITRAVGAIADQRHDSRYDYGTTTRKITPLPGSPMRKPKKQNHVNRQRRNDTPDSTK